MQKEKILGRMTADVIPDDTGSSVALEPVAMVALDAGRMLMEAGASAHNVDEIVDTVARGLGAERVDLRIGYASLAITIGIGESASPGCVRWANRGEPAAGPGVARLADRVAEGG